jgi:predicted GTPase
MELVSKVMKEIEIHLKDGRKGEMMRDGIQVAIVGPPNAGKSSLINLIGSWYYVNHKYLFASNSKQTSVYSISNTR